MRAASHSVRLALSGLLALALLAGCDEIGVETSPSPQARPAGLKPPVVTPAPRSAASEDLARYYARVQNDLLTRGLLRTDGGGPDTPFSADALAQNFETIAFYDEYTTGTGVATRGNGNSGHLSRWAGPIRIGTEFGASVPPKQRETDEARVAAYASRLSSITGHPISVVSRNANFNVFIVGEDDNDFLLRRLVEVIPGISQTELDLFRNLPRSFYCLVVAVSGSRTPYQYTRAVALIRAEHPDLVRQSCIHEEIAQGLGLPNDSPSARPSIFNDDDEFALLTNHDELLLKMLYDPRLELGMTVDEARPVARIIARDLMGQPL